MTDTQTTVSPPTYSERVTADRLGIARMTLTSWRKKGLLNPALFTDRGLRPEGRTTPKAYDAATVDKLITGELGRDFMFVEREADQ